MNPRLKHLQPYPFEKLRALLAPCTPAPVKPISFGIGEPQHPTPPVIKEALIAAIDDLARYPAIAGTAQLRQAIAEWLQTRYRLSNIDPATQVIPVAGSREALFSLAQTVIDSRSTAQKIQEAQKAIVLCPNPGYQIYEGAALLGGAQPYFVNVEGPEFLCDYTRVPEDVWQRTQLLYVCTPSNPTGAVLTLADWQQLFTLSDRYGFVIASDECYSEIYFDEAHPPIGVLEAAHRLNREFTRLIMLSSLSKRSNAPGLRSGFAAGDAALIKSFLQYRTYHGASLSLTVQAASVAAWRDETHVRENRKKYAEKFQAVMPILANALEVRIPTAGFYLWANVAQLGIDDTQFAQRLFTDTHVTVLPGSYLARDAQGINPGRHYVRLALVASIEECIEGAKRIAEFCQNVC